MNNDQLLEKINKRFDGIDGRLGTLEQGQKQLEQGQKELEKGQQEQGEAIQVLRGDVTSLKEGQKRLETEALRVKSTLKTIEHTVNGMNAGLEEVVKNHREQLDDHEKRLEELEEDQLSTHKN